MTALSFMSLKADSITKRVIIFLFLLILHVAAAIPGFNRLNSTHEVPGLTLDASPKDWAEVLYEGDPGGYLGIANSIVSSHGFSRSCKGCNPPIYSPTDFWGPGAPATFAFVISIGKFFGSSNMMPLFLFGFLADFFCGLVLMGIVWNYSKNFLVLLIAAFFNGFCPPIQAFLYSGYLTASETVNCIPMVVTFYFLTLGITKFWKKAPRLNRYFLCAGLALGFAGITRESNFQFVYFTITLFFIQTLIRQRERIKPAMLSCMIFFLAAYAPRLATQTWNQSRLGEFIVSRAGPQSDPRNYFFGKYDPTHCFLNSIGFAIGDFLDPDISKDVNTAFAKGEGTPLLVYQNVALAILKHPFQFFKFKIQRFPILAFGTDKWPYIEISFQRVWTAILYFIYFTYLIYIIGIKRQWPPEMVYYYFAFIFSAYVVIMLAEFRYSFPALYGIRIVPALLVASLLKDYFKIDSLEDNEKVTS